MKRRVVVTGMGVLAGKAENREQFSNVCLVGEGSIRKCTAFDPKGLSTPYYGEVFRLEPNEQEVNGRYFELLRLTAQGLLDDAGVTKETIAAWGRRCRLFFGTLIFSSDAFYQHSLRKKSDETGKDSYIAHMNDFSAHAKKLLGVQGSSCVISSSCASGTTAAGMALDYIRSGRCDYAVVGGVDALSIVTAYGFHSLKSMSGGICNPFDEERDGINIGECGALFLFETLESAKARGAEILGEITGYALGNDAYHITSPRPDGDGAYRVMQEALLDAEITANDIGYMNAHGTGTTANDSMELKALEKLFGEAEGTSGLPVSSTKALFGHCMGASGALELANVLLSLQQQEVAPMPRLKKNASLTRALQFSVEKRSMSAEYALKSSFAFSGNSAAIVLRHYAEEGES